MKVIKIIKENLFIIVKIFYSGDFILTVQLKLFIKLKVVLWFNFY